jgi:hypothetical protein
MIPAHCQVREEQYRYYQPSRVNDVIRPIILLEPEVLICIFVLDWPAFVKYTSPSPDRAVMTPAMSNIVEATEKKPILTIVFDAHLINSCTVCVSERLLDHSCALSLVAYFFDRFALRSLFSVVCCCCNTVIAAVFSASVRRGSLRTISIFPSTNAREVWSSSSV